METTEAYIAELGRKVAANRMEALQSQAYADARAEGRAMGLSGVELDAMVAERARTRCLEIEADMQRLQDTMTGDA